MKSLTDISLSMNDRRVAEAAGRLLRERFPIAQVVLFGSKARGSDDPESDIDLLVLTARKLHWREEQALSNALFDVELTHDVVLSPLIVSADEWFQGVYRVLPIHDEIARDGVAA